MILILAEKPSVGRALSSVVGANKTNKGYIEGCGSPVATSERNLRSEAPTEPTGETATSCHGVSVTWSGLKIPTNTAVGGIRNGVFLSSL